MSTKDHHARLEVGADASLATIKRAYRRLARRYHPDVSQLPDGEAQFKAVTEAYEVLGDAGKRAAHDLAAHRESAAAFKPASDWAPGATKPDDFFEGLFANRSDHAPGGDQQAGLKIALKDAYLGAHHGIVLSQAGAQRRIQVDIPKGVRDGQRLRLAGLGLPGRGGQPAGDLYLRIELLPHALFQVHGADVIFELPLAPWEAALGASLTVPTPAGGTLQLTVPAGAAPGSRLRLEGQGLPGATPGDLFARLSLVLPPAATTPSREAYEALARASAGFEPRPLLKQA